MELETIQEYMTVFEIPFYIAGDKFICQGLTVEQVSMVEEINQANEAIIFYDDKYNEKTNNSSDITEPEVNNVIYYDFVKTEEQEEEQIVNKFDDILSKFDNVEITTDSKIAAADVEFCKEQENIYKQLVTVYNSLIPQLQAIKELDNAHGKKYGEQNDKFFYAQNTAFSCSIGIQGIEKTISEMKHKFILSVCHYFKKKYKISIEHETIQKKYNSSVTYEQIIDEIYIQLGGYNFTEKAENEIKDNLRKEFSHKEAAPKGNKLILNGFLYIDDSWKKWGDEKIHYNSTSKLEQLFKALQHYEDGSIKLNEQMQTLFKQVAHGKNEAVFNRHELNYNKVKSIKIFKNGKVEIEFSSYQDATKFNNEYCASNVA